jgi:carbonic anhydrase/acetyltransferase-like protein (isoleucine patch superfamily)
VSFNRPARAGPAPEVRSSAVVLGEARLGHGSLLAEGAVIRSVRGSFALGAGSAVLENSVIVATPEAPVQVGRRSVFGHRCLVVGASVGDLCEIGNASLILPGARVGDGCFLGEGTIVAAGTVIPSGAVVVGRPGRVIRRGNDEDERRLLGLRGGDLSLPDPSFETVTGTHRAGGTMGRLYAYKDKVPEVDPTAVLFDSAEITGDVVIGAQTIIGAGVKIVGDSHGPVRIGARVQILENTVLHLLPDNDLILADDVVIGPGSMIHGCHIGAGTVVEPGAIVCDWSVVGAGSHVMAGALVKQRDRFDDGAVIDGSPAKQVGTLDAPPARPGWALDVADLASIVRLS